MSIQMEFLFQTLKKKIIPSTEIYASWNVKRKKQSLNFFLFNSVEISYFRTSLYLPVCLKILW